MRNEGAFEKWDPAEQTPVSPRGSSRTHLWVSSFCFSNSRLFRSCSFCLSRSASMDFCFCSCCLLCISLSSWEESGQVMKTWTEAHERLTSTQRFTVTKPRTLAGNFSGLTTVHLEIEITIFWHNWLPVIVPEHSPAGCNTLCHPYDIYLSVRLGIESGIAHTRKCCKPCTPFPYSTSRVSL